MPQAHRVAARRLPEGPNGDIIDLATNVSPEGRLMVPVASESSRPIRASLRMMSSLIQAASSAAFQPFAQGGGERVVMSTGSRSAVAGTSLP